MKCDRFPSTTFAAPQPERATASKEANGRELFHFSGGDRDKSEKNHFVQASQSRKQF
jgi:hypothetical protein